MAVFEHIIRCLKVSQALVVRLIYAVHASIAVTIAGLIVDSRIFWFQLFILVSLLEYCITMKNNKDGDWKCISPSVFIYLLWLVPQIFILEANARTMMMENKTATVGLIKALGWQHASNNSAIINELWRLRHNLVPHPHTLLVQTMMVIIVIGRMIGPKGFVTRGQLSQMMVSFYGMACDMLEFFTQNSELLYELSFRGGDFTTLHIIMMSVWSLSLCQFGVNLKLVFSDKGKRSDEKEDSDRGTTMTRRDRKLRAKKSSSRRLVKGELVSILTSLLFQDGIYLAARLYVMLKYFDRINIFSNLLFYTCKNTILIIILSYRLLAAMEESLVPASIRRSIRSLGRRSEQR